MKKFMLFLSGIMFLSGVQNIFAQFTYISPVPESKMHNRQTGIILRTGSEVDAASLDPDFFEVSGSLSGVHTLRVLLAADKKSILVQPTTIFSFGETVTVSISDGIRNADGSLVKGMNFSFIISKDHAAKQKVNDNATDESGELESEGGTRTTCDHLPPFEITSVPGAYYDAPFLYRNYVAPPGVSDCWMATIISSAGDSLYGYYNNNIGFDFKLNDNGYFTWYNKMDSCFDMLDSSYNLVKKIYMGYGYHANKHECRMYPNGYRLMFCYDQQTVDMTYYGGLPDAEVTGVVIQQIDPDEQVIFEWRSWDHFQFTDAANDIPLTTGSIDYVHSNSMELDFDGNLLLSSRHLDEITKIDLSNGNIIWRMGGKNNEFTFIDNLASPKPFSHQHHFRRLPNGHYSLFDNGNNQNTEVSIAKEFVLDQVNKTATLVWSYIHPPVNGYNVYGSGLGSVQLLPNGNRLIDWGQVASSTAFAPIPNFTEVDSSGNIVWEFRFKDSAFVCYRVEKFLWDRCNLVADSSMTAENITATGADLHWNDHSKFSGFVLEYRECGSLSWMPLPLNTNTYQLEGLQVNTCYEWRVQSICAMYGDSFYTKVHQFTTLNPVGAGDPGIAKASFNLYPNPAISETMLSYTSLPDEQPAITIYNLQGIKVFYHSATPQKSKNQFRIDLQLVPPGIYTVELKLSAGIQYRQLVIQ